MASQKEFLQFLLEQLSGLEGVDYRPMMGEYILYFRGRVIGGLFDDRLLVKRVPSAEALWESPVTVIPYDGAKPMLLVEEVDDPDFLARLFLAAYPELPEPKRKSKKK